MRSHQGTDGNMGANASGRGEGDLPHEGERPWTLVAHRGDGPPVDRLWRAWLRGDAAAACQLLSAEELRCEDVCGAVDVAAAGP